jgi:predicted alpha/beta-hydrolase family hydrolase
MMMFLFDGPEDARVTILLAHGAGAPDGFGLDERHAKAMQAGRPPGFRVARFEFGYMAARRTGTRKPPPKAETVMPEYVAAIDDLGPTNGPLIIGGKSMGGRVASMVADACSTRAASPASLPRLSLPSAGGRSSCAPRTSSG